MAAPQAIVFRCRLKAKGFAPGNPAATFSPPSAPERHINPDGSFCLYWEGSEQLDVGDDASARVWMETLVQFLRLQDVLRKLGDGRHVTLGLTVAQRSIS